VYATSAGSSSAPASYTPAGPGSATSASHVAEVPLFGLGGKASDAPLASLGDKFLARRAATGAPTDATAALVGLFAQPAPIAHHASLRHSDKAPDSLKAKEAISAYTKLQPAATASTQHRDRGSA
jgi:hypothetical protein